MDPMEVDGGDFDPIDGGPKLSTSSFDAPTENVVQPPPPQATSAQETLDLLHSPVASTRCTAARRLPTVAAAVSGSRCRSELLPFLQNLVLNEEDDVVLEATAVALGHVDLLHAVCSNDESPEEESTTPSAAQYNEYAHLLLQPLEVVLQVEEVAVREAACQSVLQILETAAAAKGDGTKLQEAATALLTRLANKEWFTARISAITLLTTTYPYLYNAAASPGDSNMDEAPEGDDADAALARQNPLLHLYQKLCHDETPMVRRVAAQALAKMVRNVVTTTSSNKDHADQALQQVQTVLVPLYEEFSWHQQPDSVRLQTTLNCVALGQVYSSSRRRSKTSALTDYQKVLLERILPIMVATIDDRSWRVRWTAAAKFAQVVQAFDGDEASDDNDAGDDPSKKKGSGPDDEETEQDEQDRAFHCAVMDMLLPAYEKLLQDPEAEVRTAATFNLHHVAKSRALVPPLSAPTQQQASPTPPSPNSNSSANNANNNTPQDGDAGAGTAAALVAGGGRRVSVAERLVKRITGLTEDDSEHVRAALARVATELAPLLGRDATITYLVPPVLLLLRDAVSEVRLNLIASLSALNEVIGVDLLSQSLLPAILDLAQDGKWRIRLAIIQHVPLLAKQLGQEFFTEKLASLCVGWLGDDIATIRQEAAANLRELTALFGAPWAIEYLIPSILEIRQHESYLRRLTALQACSMMATVMDPETARLQVLPLVLQMSADAVPNIRFNVAKELQIITPICGLSVYESQVHPILAMLMEDDDRDVRFYSEKAVAALDEHFSSMDT